MKKIKLLFLIDYLWGIGGTERFVFQVIKNIDKDRFSCILCPFNAKEKEIHKFRENGITVVNIPITKIYGVKAFIQSFKLIKLIKENDIDIVQTFHFVSDTYGALVSKIAGVSHIVSSRRDMGDLKKKSYVFISKRANKLIDHFIMVSNAVGRSFAAIEKIPFEKMETIYNGVDLPNWKLPASAELEKIKVKLNLNSGGIIIGYIAHFRPGKGHNVFFEATKKIKPLIKNMKALVVGGGQKALINHYKRFCEDNQLQEDVIITGYTEEVRKYLSVMDVYCLVSDNEGCSNSILEAMASGKPVITTAVGGNPELVVNGETGILIPPNDAGALVQAILKLYQNPELRLSMGNKARQHVERNFSLQKMINNMEEFYIQLCENEKD